MNTKFKTIMQFIGQLVCFILLSSCTVRSNSIPTATSIPVLPTETLIPVSTPLPGPWRVIGTYNADQNIMTAGFLDEFHVATGGVVGQMGYSSNGGKNWLVTNAMADCRYGMDIVSPDLIWSCGGATNVRRSVDGGKTWQALTAFGDPRTITNPCHSASFFDETTGWLANSNLFGSTVDGGISWAMRALPETATKIATIDTYESGKGYLLDQSSYLFFTEDDGQHWQEAGQLDWGELTLPATPYQLVAMRFSDKGHGMIVVSSNPFGKDEPVIAFHTSNGGETWTSEPVPVLAGPVYLAREGGYLTVITDVNQLTLLQYDESWSAP